MARHPMTRSRRREAPEVARYTQKTLHRDREYGFFWYSALWRVVLPPAGAAVRPDHRSGPGVYRG